MAVSPLLSAGDAQKIAVGMNGRVNGWRLGPFPCLSQAPGQRAEAQQSSSLSCPRGDPVRACLVSFSFPPRVSGWDPQGLRCIGLSGSWICRLLGKAPALLWLWCILLLVDEETDAQAGRAVGQGWGCSPHRAALRMWPCCVRPSCVFIGSADLY